MCQRLEVEVAQVGQAQGAWRQEVPGQLGARVGVAAPVARQAVQRPRGQVEAHLEFEGGGGRRVAVATTGEVGGQGVG